MADVDTPLQRSHRDNDAILRSLNERGLETIKFDDVKYSHEQIGEGFWGEVFKIQSGNNVMVLKTCKVSNSWQGQKYSLNEVEIMRTLDHPNIVKFLGVCVTDKNELYPLLEYIDGGTLEDFLQNDSIQIPWITRLHMAVGIANGMRYLHNHNIMHRDLTSSNILLRIEKTGSNDEVQVEALISDFGLAKEMQKERALSQVGSVDWMAPEVILGKQYDKKADVFSYGIILCEMIGRCEADPDTSVIRTLSFEVDFDDFTQRSCEGCPPQFLELAKRCCQLDPVNRPTFEQVYETCHVLIESLYDTDWDNIVSSNRKSMEKLTVTDNNVNTSRCKTPDKPKDLVLDHEPRFSVVLDELKLIGDQDCDSIRSFNPKNSLRLKEDDTNRRASIINPIPSVNRNNGRIVLTIRNDASSPCEGARASSVEPPSPFLVHELARLNERDERKALDELSIHSTLVLFDPGQTNTMTKRRASSGKSQHKNSDVTRSEEVPFARRQFSKKKKIRPVWKNMFNKSKSPRQDHKTGLISFLKSFGNKHDPTSTSKSKIARSSASDDKQSGFVTRFAAPPLSPKHTKYHREESIDTSETLTTPTYEPTDLFCMDRSAAECDCGECRECFFRESGRSAGLVARNESYRAMKPLRTQSVPVEYTVSNNVKGSLYVESQQATVPNSRPSRSRSFRDKFGFLPDKSKPAK